MPTEGAALVEFFRGMRGAIPVALPERSTISDDEVSVASSNVNRVIASGTGGDKSAAARNGSGGSHQWTVTASSPSGRGFAHHRVQGGHLPVQCLDLHR